MKRALAIALSAALLCCGLPALAHVSQSEYDRDLKLALFGNADYVFQSGRDATFQDIADAAALCVDQFSPNDSLESLKAAFEDLSERVDLSMSFQEIDLNMSVAGENVTLATHRMYTHQGWLPSECADEEFWDTRKGILLETAQRNLFAGANPFVPWLSDIVDKLTGPSEQCDAFCAVVYYIHILGDHLDGDAPDKLTALEPLAQSGSLSNPGIIPELQKYLLVLFAGQKTTRTFLSLMQDLDVLGRKAEAVYSSQGSIDTQEACAANMKNAEELLTLLGDRLPFLLRNEDFFMDAFYGARIE